MPIQFLIFSRKSLLFVDERIFIAKILITKCERQNIIVAELPATHSNNPHFKWTANTTDLVELIYAVHGVRCINNGNVTLKQVVTAFERMFKLKISKSSHVFGKNCDRIEKTPFIQSMLDNLISKIIAKDSRQR